MGTNKRIGIVDPSDLIDAMRRCRDAMVEMQRCYPYRSTIYREASVIMRDIDSLALLITGKSDYFAPPRHSNPAI